MTSSKASKATVVPADINAVNEAYASQFIDFIKKGLSTEIKIWEDMVQQHLAGVISVRGMKATIEAVNETAGALPSIAPTGAQYFADTVKVRALAGGAEVSLKASINVTTQGVRKFGKAEFASKISEAKDFATLAKIVDKQPAKPKAESTSTDKALFTDLDGALEVVAKFINEADEDLLLIKKVDDAERLIGTLQFFIRNAKAVQALGSELDSAIERHPAKGKSKAKA
jgi:hypothetical protein